MNRFTAILKPLLSLFAISLISIVMSPSVFALAITASVDYSLGGVPTGTDVDGPVSSGTVDVLGSVTDVSGNNIFYHTFGNDAGHFGSRVSGAGTYEIEGVFSYENTFTNSSASAQAFDFAFEVIPGQLAVYGDPTFGTGLSSYSLDIRLNGTSIWDSSAELALGLGGHTFTETGSASLGGTYNGTDNYSWSTFTETLGLGTFAAGESFTLEYDLMTYSMGTFSEDCVVEVTGPDGGRVGDGQDGFDPDLADGEGGFFTHCGGIARIGDPFSLGGGNSGSVIPVSAPANASLFLCLFGLILFTRNKRLI